MSRTRHALLPIPDPMFAGARSRVGSCPDGHRVWCPRGSPVILLVSLPEKGGVRASLVRGEVIWKKAEAAGIRFTVVSSEAMELIRELQRAGIGSTGL